MTHQSESIVSRRKFVAGVGGAGALALAGCTEGEGSDSLSGKIRISGSSTVFPIAQAVGELFQEDYPDVNTNLSKDGSSGGFEKFFVPGDSDINNASRPIKDAEVEGCEENGFEPVEFLIAQDALTVIVNNENGFIDGLNYDQLEQIWQPDGPDMWSDVDDSWPNEPINLFGAASTSGTFDYFTETVLGETGRIREDYEGTENDDSIASGVKGDKYAMGFLPFAYYTNNPEETTAVPMAKSGSDYTEPSLDNASTGVYPLARPLFFYANSNKLENKERLQAFIQFYINKSKDKSLIADQIGYVQSSDEQAQENLDTLKEYAGDLPLTLDGE